MLEESDSLQVFECPRCRSKTRLGARFCRRCGAAVSTPKSSEAVELVASLPAGDSIPPIPSERVRASWNDVKMLIWLFALLLMSSLVLGLSSRSGPALAVELAVTGFDAMVILAFVIWRAEDVREYLAVRLPGLRRIAENIGGGAVFFAVVELYFAVLTKMGVPTVSMTHDYVAAQWPLWAIFGITSIAPAIFEELAFRGVIQGVLTRVLLKPREALVVQAALFSVLHLSPVIFPSHFFMGLVLGYMRDRNETLYPGMLLHAAWNAYVIHGELAI